MTVEEFNRMREEVQNLNNRIMASKPMQEAKKKTLKELLAKHGVAKFTELEAKKAQLDKDMEEEYQKMQEFVETQAPKVAELERLLSL